jgi:hypothetical protein
LELFLQINKISKHSLQNKKLFQFASNFREAANRSQWNPRNSVSYWFEDVCPIEHNS